MRLLKETLFWFGILVINAIAVGLISILFLGYPPTSEGQQETLVANYFLRCLLYVGIVSLIASSLVFAISKWVKPDILKAIKPTKIFAADFLFLIIFFLVLWWYLRL